MSDPPVPEGCTEITDFWFGEMHWWVRIQDEWCAPGSWLGWPLTRSYRLTVGRYIPRRSWLGRAIRLTKIPEIVTESGILTEDEVRKAVAEIRRDPEAWLMAQYL